ncbi:thioredoxin family protein [Sulfolobus acidocaldarius]|uniref:Conserved protein n=4 Tax=Sulfolobus acidocaldarius TaxID=2285 RepID=Q4JBS3_SULAC|nr:thioredoxin family protein [Sulfolobus acidocaldarius]AAY79756.1 conserved protein [Sulfolobus acidocaldarius DSM 639]AGE70315.1 hypothetical protein SacN8_01670 [Sulfolobus acidocaldarius N8]AGE72590.1 hypothetical protein SacRon12I_01670 [Sulfolobus acidocaldarius Ron12/I]ALU29286.1 glutaredoxin [Sulfolobus acidocaldarius]ALU32014.1 glutaredoxin [Sulfolobus acidocaldarius]
MSYDNIIREYTRAIKSNITIYYCDGEELINYLKDVVVTKQLEECQKPLIKVQKDNRTYFTYYGIPTANELWPFLNALARISNDIVQLDQKEIELAKGIRGNIKLFVTPDCTKCPITAEFLYQLVQINPDVTLEIFDVTEYEYEKEKYRVLSVPKIVFNERTEIPGGFPSTIILKMMIKALEKT